METRKLFLALGLVALLVSPLMAGPSDDALAAGVINGQGYYGGEARVYRLNSYSEGPGGEFTVAPGAVSGNPLLLNNANYSDLTRNVYTLGSFQTFCVERGENLSPTEDVHVWVSTEFIDPPSAPGSHSWATSVNLTDETAWLYTQFARGTLDYDYVPGVGRFEDSTKLQHAIWYFQGQGTPSQLDESETKGAYYIDLANNAVEAGWSGIGSVRILQTWQMDSAGGLVAKQDVLYLVPTPGAILLAGIGTSLVGLLRRRKAM